MKILMTALIGILLSISNGIASEANSSEKKVLCPDERPMVCTRDYRPVCGLSQDSTTKTYSNACSACSNSDVVSYVSQACAERTLSSEELIKLFSGNTYVAVIPSRKLKMIVYVDPDGTMRGMQSGHKFTSKWMVNDKGEICVSYKDKMSCRVVMEQNGVYKKFKINEQGEKTVLVVYQSFSQGNVHNY